LGDHFILIADIDASATQTWNDGAGFEPIGPDFSQGFSGSFDGNGKKITGLFIDRPSQYYIGLFGYIAYEGSVFGAALVDVDIRGDASVGGLAGGNEGAVAESFVTGTVAGNVDIGGLVGTNEGGEVRDCYANARIIGGQYVGGLMGFNWEGTVYTSYAMGRVSGWGAPGGLLGGNYGGAVTCSYWNLSTSEQDMGNGDGNSTGITGIVDSKFKDAGLFEDFDFDLIWAINGNATYPYLTANPLPDSTDNSPTGNILFVDRNVSSGDGSGDSWENAIPELADALLLARDRWGADGTGAGWDQTDPLQIWVARGTYKPLYGAADNAY